MFSCEGVCPICEGKTVYRADSPWFRGALKCDSCGSVPRERAIAYMVGLFFPGWRNLAIHECAPVNRGFTKKLKNECENYMPTHYFPNQEMGKKVMGYRNEDIEAQTFEDNLFEIVISLDVMEHLFDPASAYREIWRTLKPGGGYIHTFPIRKGQKEAMIDRAVRRQDGSIEHLVDKPEYHGNSFEASGSLVTKDYGYDISKQIAEWAPFDVQVTRFWDKANGIMGDYTEVIVCRKG